MSGADLHELEEIKGLIASGLQAGVLTHAEIASATAELGLEDTDVDELHEIFERCEIELVEEIDPATAAGLIIECPPDKRTQRNAALSLEPEGTTDGLQLFVKGIGKVRLLTAQDSSSRPTRRGGSGRRSLVRWRTRRGRSGSRCTSSRSSTGSGGRSASS
jgi:RNA polymerase primary sigma factor